MLRGENDSQIVNGKRLGFNPETCLVDGMPHIWVSDDSWTGHGCGAGSGDQVYEELIVIGTSTPPAEGVPCSKCRKDILGNEIPEPEQLGFFRNLLVKSVR